MKLKEKLAIEAVEARDLISNVNRQWYGEGFLAGFEKAREMAAESFLNSHGKCLGMTFQTAFKRVWNDLEAIGEEEVG